MTDSKISTPYEMIIEVVPEDIDQMGHVNNVVYLRWVQMVATKHWHTLATDEERDNLLWVVKKHVIEYKRPAFEGEKIIARTWLGDVTKRFFERHTELLRESDHKLLTKVSTIWTPIDFHTKRAIHVSPDLYARFSNPGVDSTD